MWQEERDPPTKTPEECHHRRTDHRGSNKQVRKTFCLDCGTYKDSVPQELARTLKEADAPWISPEKQARLLYISDAADDLLCLDLGGRLII